MSANDLKTEWCLQQNQYDSYEKHSLYVKLVAVVVAGFGLLPGVPMGIALLLIPVLWLQDAIWKTFQSRIEARLLMLEQAISSNSSGEVEAQAFQFNQQFQRHRSGVVALIQEYISQAVRPTIAFPYVVLLPVVIVGAQFIAG